MPDELQVYDSLQTVQLNGDCTNSDTMSIESFKTSLEMCEDCEQHLLKNFIEHLGNCKPTPRIQRTFGIQLLKDGKIVEQDIISKKAAERFLMSEVTKMIESRKKHLANTCLYETKLVYETINRTIPGTTLETALQQYELTFGCELSEYVLVYNLDNLIAANAMRTREKLLPGSTTQENLYHGSTKKCVYQIAQRQRIFTPEREQNFSLLKPFADKRLGGLYLSTDLSESSTYAHRDDNLQYLLWASLHYEKADIVQGDKRANPDKPWIVQNFVKVKKNGEESKRPGSTFLVENASQTVRVKAVLGIRTDRLVESAQNIAKAVDGGKHFRLCVMLAWLSMLKEVHYIFRRAHPQFKLLATEVENLKLDTRCKSTAEKHEQAENEIFSTQHPKQHIPRALNYYESQQQFWIDGSAMLQISELKEFEQKMRSNLKAYTCTENLEKLFAMAKAQSLTLRLPAHIFQGMTPREFTQILLDSRIIDYRSFTNSDTYSTIVRNSDKIAQQNVFKMLQAHFGSAIFKSYFEKDDMRKHLPVNLITTQDNMDTLFLNIILQQMLSDFRYRGGVRLDVHLQTSSNGSGILNWSNTFRQVFAMLGSEGTNSFPVPKEDVCIWLCKMFQAFCRQIIKSEISTSSDVARIPVQNKHAFILNILLPMVELMPMQERDQIVKMSRDLFVQGHQLYLKSRQAEISHLRPEQLCPRSGEDTIWKNILDKEVGDFVGFMVQSPMSFMLLITERNEDQKCGDLLQMLDDALLYLSTSDIATGESVLVAEQNEHSSVKSLFLDIKQYLEAFDRDTSASSCFSGMQRHFFGTNLVVENMPRREKMLQGTRLNIWTALRNDLLSTEESQKVYTCNCAGWGKNIHTLRLKVIDVVSCLQEPTAKVTTVKDSWMVLTDLAEKNDKNQKIFEECRSAEYNLYRNQNITSFESSRYLLLKLGQIGGYEYVWAKRKNHGQTSDELAALRSEKRKKHK